MVKIIRTNKRLNYCIITFPINSAGFTPLKNLTDIFRNFSNKMTVITSRDFNNVYSSFNNDTILLPITFRKTTNVVIKIFNFIKAQFEITVNLCKVAKQTHVFIFFIGGESLVLPVLVGKLLRKKMILCHPGSAIKSAQFQQIPLISFLRFSRFFVRLLVNNITVYSKNIIVEDDLENFRFKTLVAHEHFLDVDGCCSPPPINLRDNCVGYVGRLTAEKGVMTFIEAISIISKKMTNFNFAIIGSGPLSEKIKKEIIKNNLSGNVTLFGWVPHQELFDHFKKMRLFVLPSLTEGLPNVVLEAIANGVPVLVNPVGALPDIIKDYDNGFLLKSTDPKILAAKIIELLGNPQLLQAVSNNAYDFLKNEFNKVKTIEHWMEIIGQYEKGTF